MNHGKESDTKTGSFTFAIVASLKLEGSSFGKAKERCVAKVPSGVEWERESEKSCATSQVPFWHFSFFLMFIFFRRREYLNSVHGESVP